MKKFIRKFKQYRYKKRIKKWAFISLKFFLRKTKRAFKTPEFRKHFYSSHAIIAYLSVLVIVGISILSTFFGQFASPYFDSDSKIIRRLSISELDNKFPYLKALESIGSTNRIQVTLKTEKENYLKPKGTNLEKGGINLSITFTDGTSLEYSLNNSNYSNFESGMTDTFTLILPFGYSAFNISDYSINVIPDINNDFGTWHCQWARVYFLIENKPVMLAKEDWENTAVFGSGDGKITKSTLKTVSDSNDSFVRVKTIYNYLLQLAVKRMENFSDDKVKTDTLDSLGFNGGKNLYIDIETANIETQNDILTYYTKGVQISEQDSLDYDGIMYLDLTFYTPLSDGSFAKTFVLDTLGTDDFELGTTSSFKIELPAGLTVFDINTATLRTDNPLDAWSPRYIRMYIKPDYTERLEIARFNNTILVNNYSTPVFYKNLIETGVSFDLSAKFRISDIVRKQIEKQGNFTFSGKLESMYFSMQSFYERQLLFYERMLELYTPEAYEENQQTEVDPTPEISQPDENVAIPETPADTETPQQNATTPQTNPDEVTE